MFFLRSYVVKELCSERIKGVKDACFLYYGVEESKTLVLTYI